MRFLFPFKSDFLVLGQSPPGIHNRGAEDAGKFLGVLCLLQGTHIWSDRNPREFSKQWYAPMKKVFCPENNLQSKYVLFSFTQPFLPVRSARTISAEVLPKSQRTRFACGPPCCPPRTPLAAGNEHNKKFQQEVTVSFSPDVYQQHFVFTRQWSAYHTQFYANLIFYIYK
jgi:hypothetical protein